MKTILITGSTDGLGLATATMLAKSGHHIYLHGRNATKIAQATHSIQKQTSTSIAGSFIADLSDFKAVHQLADKIKNKLTRLDVLINNAGVFQLTHPLTADGLDARLVVNTIAPYMLTRELLPILREGSRVINLSSAAQAPVDLAALRGQKQLPANLAYAQSKLGITMWTQALAAEYQSKKDSPILLSINPRSYLATNMVRTAYGMAGVNINIGADILSRAALSPEFANANGQYYDNDQKRFSQPHPDATKAQKCAELVQAMDTIIKQYS